MTGPARRRVMTGLAGVLVGVLTLGTHPAPAQTADPAAPPPAAVDLPTPPDGRPFVEYDETIKGWKLYCQLWPATRRTECEISTRGVNDRNARLVWLRSTERWLDGLRFRFEVGALEADKPVRIWADKAVFRPEFPCKPFPFESNTCAVADPEINRKLVEKLFVTQEVAAVGQTAAGAKAEVRFALAGFKAAVERTDQLRTSLGAPWMTQAAPQPAATTGPGSSGG
jgi:invasion protein IalB